MKRQGELLGAAQGTVRGYSLTESADEWFRDGTGRIMDGPPAMSDEHWVIAAFTVPEAVRSMRYRIRSRLQALGFGQLSGGLMIAPAWILDEAMRALDRAGLGGHVDMWQSRHIGFSSMKTIVANAWNLDQIDTAYRDYLDLADDLERRQAPPTTKKRLSDTSRTSTHGANCPSSTQGSHCNTSPKDGCPQRRDRPSHSYRPTSAREPGATSCASRRQREEPNKVLSTSVTLAWAIGWWASRGQPITNGSRVAPVSSTQTVLVWRKPSRASRPLSRP